MSTSSSNRIGKSRDGFGLLLLLFSQVQTPQAQASPLIRVELPLKSAESTGFPGQSRIVLRDNKTNLLGRNMEIAAHNDSGSNPRIELLLEHHPSSSFEGHVGIERITVKQCNSFALHRDTQAPSLCLWRATASNNLMLFINYPYTGGDYPVSPAPLGARFSRAYLEYGTSLDTVEYRIPLYEGIAKGGKIWVNFRQEYRAKVFTINSNLNHHPTSDSPAYYFPSAALLLGASSADAIEATVSLDDFNQVVICSPDGGVTMYGRQIHLKPGTILGGTKWFPGQLDAVQISVLKRRYIDIRVSFSKVTRCI